MFCHLIIVEHNKFKDIEKTELYYDDNEKLFEALELLYNADFKIKLNIDKRYISNNLIRNFLEKIEPEFIEEVDSFKDEELFELLIKWLEDK